MNWVGWPLERVLLLFVGIVFLVLFVQVTLFHYRQNFHHWAMWVPVIETPIFGMLTILLAFYNADWLQTLVMILLIIGILSGLTGSFYHIRGVGGRVGGYALRNFLVGPPLTLPAFITVMSILGLIALYWG